MQLAITNLSADDLVLAYLEKVIKPGATIVLETPQSELCKMLDLQQAVTDGLAEYQVTPNAIEVASEVLTASIPGFDANVAGTPFVASGNDDWPRWDALITASLHVRFKNGSFLSHTRTTALIQSGSRIESDPGVTIDSDAGVAVGFPSNYTFMCDAEGVIANTIELASLGVVNTDYVVVTDTADPVVGHYLDINECEIPKITDVGACTIGTADVTAAGLYGGTSTLDTLTLALNVNGAGETSLTLAKAANVATLAALLAAILAKWPTLKVAAVGGAASNKLVLGAVTGSLVVGGGTANILLGLTAGAVAGCHILTLDSVIVRAYTVTTTCTEYTKIPENIEVNLAGAVLRGHCNQHIQVFRSRNVTLRNLTFKDDTVFGDNSTGVWGFDLASSNFRVDHSRCDYPAGAAPVTAAYVQTCKNGVVTDHFARNALVGFSVLDSYGMDIVAHRFEKCGIGLNIGRFSPATWGCRNITVLGGGAIDCGSGVSLGASDDSKVIGWTSEGCADYGIYEELTTNAKIESCALNNNRVGWYVQNNCGITHAKNITTNNNRQAGAILGASTEVSGWTMTNTSAAQCIDTTGGTHRWIGLDVTDNLAGGQMILVEAGTVRTEIIGGTLGNSTSSAVSYIVIGRNGSGLIYLEKTVATGPLAFGVTLDAGAHAVFGPGCDFSGCWTPLNATNAAPSATTTSALAMTQTGGVAMVAITGANVILTWAQNYCTMVEASGALTGPRDCIFLPIPGNMYWITDATSGNTVTYKTSQAGDVGIAGVTGKKALVGVNAAGNMVKFIDWA